MDVKPASMQRPLVAHGAHESHGHPLSKNQKLSFNVAKKAMTITLVTLLVLVSAAAGLFYHKYQQIKQNPNSVTVSQTNQLIGSVGKLLALPSGETPTIATVVDPTKLKAQPFFANVAIGDKLLVYSNAKKAIIYRPTTNKIINVGPITMSNNAATASASATTVQKK